LHLANEFGAAAVEARLRGAFRQLGHRLAQQLDAVGLFQRLEGILARPLAISASIAAVGFGMRSAMCQRVEDELSPTRNHIIPSRLDCPVDAIE